MWEEVEGGVPGRADSPRAAAGPGHPAGESWREVERTRGGIIILIFLPGKFVDFYFCLFSIIIKRSLKVLNMNCLKLYQTSN